MKFLETYSIWVATDGTIYKKDGKTPLKHQVCKAGYHRIYCSVFKKRIGLGVHRAVAFAYIPNPLMKSDVNHKDGNKSNNDVLNLEWCTRLENMTHAKKMGLWDGFMGKRLFKNRDELIVKLISVGVTKKQIMDAFELKEPALNAVLRKFRCTES